MVSAAGAWSSIAGLGISVLGFGLTLWLLVRSKTSADAARQAAARAAEGIRTVRWLADFTAIHHDLEKAKVMMREGALQGLPEQFSGLRRHLIRVRAVVREEGGVGERDLHEAIKFCSMMEQKFDRSQGEATDVAVTDRDRAMLNDQIDRITDLTARLQVGLERRNSGTRRD
jgi:flavin-binding protein dodecin